MIVKTRKSKVLALALSLLIALAFMPTIASAATSTDLEFSSKGGSPTKAVETTVGAEKPGYIAAKATGEGVENDKVTCVSADESVAKVVDQGTTDMSGCWKFDIVGKNPGATTITVTAVDNPENKAVVNVIVRDPSIGIYIDVNSPSKGAMATAIGSKKGGLIAAYAANGTEPYGKVTCKSADESIAEVKATDKQMQGKWWKFDVIGKKLGETTVTIASVEDPTVEVTVTVTVIEELITVKHGNLEKGFNFDEFGELPAITVDDWAGRNHYFTYTHYPEKDKDPKSKGPLLERILTEAGVDVSALADDQIIKFIPSDNDRFTGYFTVKQILRTPRYYFPHAADLEKGAIATPAQLADAVEVPTIINEMDNTDSRLVFGQVAPNERTNSASVKNMSSGGVIEITDQMAETLECDVTADIPSGSNVAPGKEIKLDSPRIKESIDIYCTTDGSDPTVERGLLYNYCTKGDFHTAVINAPKKPGPFTVKVMQFAYGANPSNVKTFKYTVPTTKGNTYATNGQKYKVTKVATSKAKGTVTFTKAKNAKTVTVPKTVKLADGRTYNVTAVAAKAFTASKVRTVNIGANTASLKPYALKGSKATKVIVKTKKFTKASVKKSLTGSKVKTVVVKVGTKKQNKTYVKKYKKFFTKANAGKKVTVK